MNDATPSRVYRSELRARQAAQTREGVLRAAAECFARHGYQATTMAAVARTAGVSVETVKAGSSKAELLIAAFEVEFSGEEGRESLADAPVAAGALGLDGETFLHAIVAAIGAANARASALWTVLLGASLSDEVVAGALRRMLDRRAADYRRLVAELARRGLADPALDVEAAAAELSFLMSPEGHQQLVQQWGWSPDRYLDWLVRGVLRVVRGAAG